MVVTSSASYGDVGDLPNDQQPGSTISGTSPAYPSGKLRGEYHAFPESTALFGREGDIITRENVRRSNILRVAIVSGLAFLGAVAYTNRVGNGRNDDVAKISGNSASQQAEGKIGTLFEIRPSDTAAAAAAAAAAALPEVVSRNPASPEGLPGSDEPLAFTALNFYHVRDGKPGQDYPWLKDVKLVEPYRDTSLAVTNAQDGHYYRWEVRAGGELQATASGAEAEVVFTTLEENVVVLVELDAGGDVTRRIEETVMVKYVRREIRTLTDDERNELLDAMYQLWAVKVDGGNGKELYGENYADIWAINRLHFKGASYGQCDHFHDGLGFLVSHSLITNTFEYSLQLVNPKLTMPYWDFTIESSTAYDGYDESEPSTISPLLQSSWFGGADPDDNMVKDGRWAFTEIPRVRANNPGGLEPDVYGKLRSPWNVNDRAYMSRGMGSMCQISVTDRFPWPTCEIHYQLETENPDFYSWGWSVPGISHGPVHIWIGGVLDCDDTYTQIGDLVGESVASELAMESMFHRKNMFCDDVWKCEGEVDGAEGADKVLQDGTCGCLDYDLTQGDDYLQVLPHLVDAASLIGDFDADVQREVVAILCSGVTNYGEHSQSSSSLDPTFWPMHPTLERLWQFAVLTEQVTKFTWPDADKVIIGPDGTETTETVSINTDHCEGHRGSDVFPFGLLEGTDDGFQIRTGIKGNPVHGGNVLTNREVLAAFSPSTNMLPYIYDTFKWEHCKVDGYDFDDAWA